MAYNAGESVDVSVLAPEYKLYAQWKPYTLTLINGGDPEVVFSRDMIGAASLPRYNSSVFTRLAGYTLDGWYTAWVIGENGQPTGQKVLDEDGNVVAAVEGYSKELEDRTFALELTENQTL